jgi:hypothetical protein
MRVRFTLRQLFGLVVYVAIACGGLLHPSATVASAIFTLTLVVLLVAILAAVARRGPRRAFWIGLAIAGWGYLWAAHWPDEASYYVINTRWELQTTGPLLTTKLLQSAYEGLHGASEAPGSGFFSVPVEPSEAGALLSLPLGQFGTSVGPASDPAILNAFMRIGHSLWAVLFAYLGGLLTRHFYETSSRPPKDKSTLT